MARRPKAAAAEPEATAGRADAPRRKGGRRTTPSVETLSGLPPERLIGLILGETARNPAFKKIVSAALAALQGPEAVAAIVDRRLSALEGARGFIDWQRRRAFTADLNATVSVIVDELRPLDAVAALDRLVRFLDGASGVLARVDDSLGITEGVYERAAEAAVEIVGALSEGEAAGFAARILPLVAGDPDGPLGMLFLDLIPRLPDGALPALDAELAQALASIPEEPGDWRAGRARGRLLRARQDIADRRGDVDAFVALEEAVAGEAADNVAIAERLLAAGRPEEALERVRRPRQRGAAPVTREALITGRVDAEAPVRARAAAEIRILDALGRGEEAQALRWQRFHDSLDAGMLRDYLAKLPDFEDDEALRAAFDRATAFPQPYRALTFLINWPDLDRAGRLVLDRAGTWEGERYEVLAPAAEALEQARPEAAALLYRRLIDDILDRGRSQAYAHAARYLAQLEPIDPEYGAFRERLRRDHGRKHAFWSLVGGR
ncbi:DUF6880 family protein [Methylobacterium oxalidis]|uniref:Uncharacterized protein n=1 Tax=Methylobacterium oxalidis TaxID=944322 RepID=A0A512IYD3_9HYPH|nr:DUF6880 family protein [Methylobacterium oxalidis]GEP02722.1 hypothetical protein MOX02_07600 [Methylobacterium oxalidis]GJE33572.1 hypothetical protein LDDCCGHA_3773 [Methylobacterium oxalidis]GLS66880.1 hypothetical protein GCM10007888_52630 [Methylobacterium oxalidis]